MGIGKNHVFLVSFTAQVNFSVPDSTFQLRKLAKRTFATHIKDTNPATGSPRDWTFWPSAPAGTGIIDMAAVIGALHDGGNDGMLCVEIDFMKDKQANEVQAVEVAVNNLRRLVREL